MSAEAEAAAEFWGARVVRPLRLRENEVYEIALPGARAAMRLHRQGYQADASIRSELWWCAALAKAGLPVPAPVAAPVPATAAGAGAGEQVLVRLPSGRNASVLTWVQGDALGLAGQPLAGGIAEQADLHRQLGALLARVHRATDDLALPDDFSRPSWDLPGLVGDAPFWGRFWEHPALTGDEAALLLSARDWLAQRLACTGSPMGLIHADVLRENVLVDGERISLIDFDDSGFGYRFYDLGTVMSQNLYEPGYGEIRAALIAGYGAPGLEAELDAFTLARCLASVGWAAPRVAAGDPVHRSHIARAIMMARRCMAGAA